LCRNHHNNDAHGVCPIDIAAMDVQMYVDEKASRLMESITK